MLIVSDGRMKDFLGIGDFWDINCQAVGCNILYKLELYGLLNVTVVGM